LGRARRSRTGVPSASMWVVESTRVQRTDQSCGIAKKLSILLAGPPDLREALLQLRLLAVVRELQEAHALGLLGHQLLRRDALGPVVRVVVALAPPERLRSRVGRALERRGRDHGTVLAHPLARPLQADVRSI